MCSHTCNKTTLNTCNPNCENTLRQTENNTKSLALKQAYMLALL